MKTKEHVFSRPLGQLPKDDKLRVLNSVGEVSYEFGPSEPVWECEFFEYEHETLNAKRKISIKLGSSIIRAAAIGSIWQDRKNVGFVGKCLPDILQLDLPHDPIEQTVIYRKDIFFKNGDLYPPIFSSEFITHCRPYLLIKLLGHFDADYALISCFEVYRYYFGYLPSVSRHFLNFDIDGNNESLFVSKNTHWVKAKNVYQIDPHPPITDLDQQRLAHYLASKSARRSMGLTAASARARYVCGQPVYPVCRVPISGLNKWKIVGRLRDIYREDVLKSQRVLTVSRIINCYDPQRVDCVESTREKIRYVKGKVITDDSNEDDTGNGNLIPPAVDGTNIPVVSDKPPGSPVKITSPDIDANAFIRECWQNTSYIRVGVEKERDRDWKKKQTDLNVDEASTQEGSGGDPNTGQVIDNPLVKFLLMSCHLASNIYLIQQNFIWMEMGAVEGTLWEVRTISFILI